MSSNTFRKYVISNIEAHSHAIIWQSKARTGMIIMIHTFPFDLDAHNTLYELEKKNQLEKGCFFSPPTVNKLSS